MNGSSCMAAAGKASATSNARKAMHHLSLLGCSVSKQALCAVRSWIGAALKVGPLRLAAWEHTVLTLEIGIA